MAERNWLDTSYNDPYADHSAVDQGISVTDIPLVAGSRLTGIVGDLGAVVRHLGEATINPEEKSGRATAAIGQFFQEVFGELSEAQEEMLSPAALRKLHSSVTSPEFWTLSNMAIQAANLAPDVAATLIPGYVFPGLMTATAGALATGAVLSASDITDELYSAVEQMDDAALQEEVPFYRDLRQKGVEEPEARRQYMQEFVGYKPLIAGTIGAVSNALGPAGGIARRVAGREVGALTSEAGEGLVKRSGKSFAEGFAGETMESGTEATIMQGAQIELGQREDYNPDEILEQSVTGGVIGGVFGGGVGALPTLGASRATTGDPLVDAALGQTQPVEMPAVNPTAPNQPGGVGPVAAPPAATANGQATPGADTANPTTGQRAAQTTTAQTPTPEASTPTPATVAGVATVEAAAPDAAQTAALNVNKPAPVTPTPEVAAPVVTSQGTPVEVAPTPETPAPVASPEMAPAAPPAAMDAAPVVDTAPAPEAAPAPDMAGTTPAPTPTPTPEAAPARTGPRILADQTVPDTTDQWTRTIDTNTRRAEFEAKGPEALIGPEGAKGQKLAKAQIDARKRLIERAPELASKFQPSETDNGVFSHRAAERAAGKASLLERAKAINEAVEAEGHTLPTKFKDTADKSLQYPAEVMLLMEARRLALKENPQLSDFVRFRKAEINIGLGRDEAAAARREEGETAMKRGVAKEDGDADAAVDAIAQDLSDASSYADAFETRDPESMLAEIDEARERGDMDRLDELMDRKRTVKEAPLKVERKAPAPDEVPASVQAVVDDIVANAQRAAARTSPPKVEVRAKRKISKPEPKKPVVTPKVAAVKERLAAARADTAPNPTPAQKEAGNYAKGSVSINGLNFTIETARNANRSGVAPDGTEWSIKMKYDYGYIKGTKGADGEQIDVLIGPDPYSPHVYIVDQVDPQTGAFDEHKVLYGFRTAQDAAGAYVDMYDSDGERRIGDITTMSQEEFKAWIEKPRSERVAVTEAEMAEVRSFMADEELEAFFNTVEQPSNVVRDPITGEEAALVDEYDAAEIIGKLNIGELAGLPKAMGQIAAKALLKRVPNVKVKFISPLDMVRMSGYKGQNIPYGYHIRQAGNGEGDFVVVRSDLLRNPDKLRHTVLHEVTHAATVRGIDADPRLGMLVDDMMGRVDQYLSQNTIRGRRPYGLKNRHEFIAEAFSNPEFQRLLSQIELTPTATADYKSLLGSVRDMWTAFIMLVRRAINPQLPSNTMTLLEAAVRVTEQAMTPRVATPRGNPERSFLEDGNATPMFNELKGRVDKLLNRPELQPSTGKPWLYRLRSFDSIARPADKLFPEGANPVRRIAKLVEQRRTRSSAMYEQSTPLIRKTGDLEAIYSKQIGLDGKTVWENFADLTLDETLYGIYADRSLKDQNISTTSLDTAFQVQQYPDLKRRWEALPQDLKDLRTELLDYFKENQRAMAKGLMQNRILKLFDVPDADGLSERLLDGTETEADKELLGEFYDTIKAAGVLNVKKGPYFPLMRRGNWVVVARTGVEAPAGGTRLSENEFEFADRDKAMDFVKKASGVPTVDYYYVDKNTGSKFVTLEGKTLRITAQDTDAVIRYKVTVQHKTVEMFDSEAEARARAAEMQRAGLEVDDVVPRDFTISGPQAEVVSPQIKRMADVIERRADAKGLSAEAKDEMLNALNELSLQHMGSTRIQSRSLPRRNVKGASKDITRNVSDYAIAVSNHRAKLETAPQMDEALTSFRDYINENRRDGMNGARQELYNEVIKRTAFTDPRLDNKLGAPVVNRLLALSFLDKLMSPSYSVINATQPMMITTPYLAAQYGIGRAYAAMGRAYSDINAKSVIAQGARDTVAKARQGAGATATDPVSIIKSRLKNKGERDMLDAMVLWGGIDTDAGMEVAAMFVKDNRFDKGLGYLEGIARQMPRAVEAINRSVSALAAYRLEMERSGDHAKAVEFAYDTLNRTQFNYSHTNAAGIFNHPMLRIATQFKKYGLGMYQFLGEQAGIMLNRTSSREERIAAAKSLGYVIGMHFLIAGFMGLPTEPIKLFVTGLNVAGVTDFRWEDVENYQREVSANLMGRTVGEMFARGLPRAFGVDLSSRMGIDTLMGPFGEPRSNESQDVKSYLWDMLAGAPAGLPIDMARGIGNLMDGDLHLAAEKLVPIKAFSDTLKAYRQMTEGTVSERTGRQITSEFGIGEGMLRAFGFTPAREAENYERQNMFYHQKDMQETARRDWMRAYTEANSAARGRIWRDIQKWNRDQPREVRLSLSDLRKYKARQERERKETLEGLRARKREKHIFDRAGNIYNFEK